MTRVFIGSTSEDLGSYRQVANEECNRLGLLPIDMKYFPAAGKGATEGSRRKLDESDLYVGIFAHRYGYIEEGYEKSVTELEFEYAAERKDLDRLCFLVDPDHEWPDHLRDPVMKHKVEAFKRRIDRSVIRAHFGSVEDFRGKLRLALQEWKLGSPLGGTPQPRLSLNLLQPTQANRLTYRARATQFAGRDRELAALEAFLEADAAFSWHVLAGPTGSGKSRLAQELSLAAGQQWRAGFLVPGQRFDWASWLPKADTLVIVDYAAERIDEVQEVLNALLLRQEADTSRAAVRLLLLERDGGGPWLQGILGSRSSRHSIERARFPAPPLELGPIEEDDLWQMILSRGDSDAILSVIRPTLMSGLRGMGVMGQPLYAVLAADALLRGRDIRDWDRAGLLSDVVDREREGWERRGATQADLNLLALSTMVGGLTEEVLEGPSLGIELPGFREFDRDLYGAMSGAEPEGEDLPPLKPDLLGEFFVLRHVSGRSDRVTALQAKELSLAAWKLCGGSIRRDFFGVPGMHHAFPSPLIGFLRHVIEDFGEHAATRHLLARPIGEGVDALYWPSLILTATRNRIAAEDPRPAMELVDELAALEDSELGNADGREELVECLVLMVPHLASGGRADEAQALRARAKGLAISDLSPSSTGDAYASAAAEATAVLLADGQGEIADELVEDQVALMRASPDSEARRAAHARALSTRVTGQAELPAKESGFERLLGFCQQHQDDAPLYLPLAQAAASLAQARLAAGRLDEAAHAAKTVRGLMRYRSEQRLVQLSPIDVEGETTVKEVRDDLTAMELSLLDLDLALVEPFVKAGRGREASLALNEIGRIWRKEHRNDPRFGRYWGWGVMKHADAVAQTGHFEQIGKAIEGLTGFSQEFPGHEEFAAYPSRIAHTGLLRATEAGDLESAAPLFERTRAMASEAPGHHEVVANYAQSALALLAAYDRAGERERFGNHLRQAAWALRSAAHLAIVRERGGEEAVTSFNTWLMKNGLIDGASSPADRSP